MSRAASTIKDNVNISNDLEGMTLALEWAAKGLYTTSPNPHIGCVIVRDGQVIGAGVTQQAGADDLPVAHDLSLIHI